MSNNVICTDYLEQLAKDQSTLSRLAKKDMAKGEFSRAGFFFDELYGLYFEEYRHYCKKLSKLEGNPCVDPSVILDIRESKIVTRNLLLFFADQQLRGEILSQLPYKPL